jgi:hypothetical protein
MSTQFEKSQTRDSHSNLAWTIVYSIRHNDQWTTGCQHDNYAEGVGQALFAFHQWMQHVMFYPVDKYRVDEVYRLLRGENRLKQKVITGKVRQDEWPRENPVTQPIHPPKPEDKTEAFRFLADIPIKQ